MTNGRSPLLWRLLPVLALAFLAGCGRQVELMAAMPEPEANEVLAALQNAGMTAQKIAGKEGMVGVTIEADQVGRAVDMLRERGLPRERFAGMGQVFKKEGLISSPLEERARYLYALSQELGATLSQIDGVVTARVHVVLPESTSTGDPGIPSSAAVFIKHQEGYNLDTVQPLVRRLVTNSIPGLAADKVTIVLIGAQPGARPSQAPATAATPRAATGVPVAVAATLGLLLAASLGGVGYLAWKPRRKTAPGEVR
ncbi:MAG: type III secretion inner membrane ring lipoprotein SctJ [Ramlibacter sp.]